MSVQRRGRNAQDAIVYKTTTITDDRGNEQVVVSDEGINIKAAFIPRSTREISTAGQAVHEAYTMIVRADIPDVGTWSTVEWRGEFWDVISPPEYHHGTRHVRHWTVEIRKRP